MAELRDRVGFDPWKLHPAEWLLALSAILVVSVGAALHSYPSVAWATIAAGALSIGLAAFAGLDVLRTGRVGRGLILAAVVFFFWTEAMQRAAAGVPFLVPDAVPRIPVPGERFPLSDLKLGLIYLTGFQLLLLVGYSIEWAVPQTWRDRIEGLREVASWGGSPTIPGWLPHVTAFLTYVPLLVATGGDPIAVLEGLVRSRSAPNPLRRPAGAWSYFTFLGMFGIAYLASRAVVGEESVERWTDAFSGILAALPLIMLGTRHKVLYLLVPVVLVAIKKAHRSLSRRRLWELGGIGVLGFLVLRAQFAFRQHGWDPTNPRVWESFANLSSVSQFKAMLLAINLVPRSHDYFMEPALPFFVTHWVPSAIWPGKPYMESWVWYNAKWAQGYSLNVTPSVMGQYHLNWGIFGVIVIGLAFGVMLRQSDRLLAGLDEVDDLAWMVTLGMFYAFLVAGLRFFAPLYLTYVGFAVLGVTIFSYAHYRGRADESLWEAVRVKALGREPKPADDLPDAETMEE